MDGTFKLRLLCGVFGLAVSCAAGAANAQGADNASDPRHAVPAADQASRSADVEAVIVTARRREETDIGVPVSVTALSARALARYAFTGLEDLTRITPAITVNEASSGLGSIYIRGMGNTSTTNPSFDQAVSINVDGIQFSRGEIFKLGQVDLDHVEVLKGPQALFFGKNSPAGIVSLTSADPTSSFQAMAQGSYEVYGDEKTVQGFVSGPVTDTLGARLAVYYSDLGGYNDNLGQLAADQANAIRPGFVAPAGEKHGPQKTSLFARGTLKWQPNDQLSVRGKLSYGKVDGGGPTHGMLQRVYCAQGTAQTATLVTSGNGGVANPALAQALAVDDCKPDNHYAETNLKNLTNAPRQFQSPDGQVRLRVVLGSVEADYKLSDQLKLTSISGYAEIHEFNYDSYSFIADLVPAIDFGGPLNFRQYTQEFRLETDRSDSALNGMVGAFYQKTRLSTYLETFAANPPGAIVGEATDGRTYSVFAQASWKIIPTLELAGGARWTREKKDQQVDKLGVVLPLSPNSATFKNVSPEVTLTYRPTQQLTIYGGYRQGFKSGGFSMPYNSSSAIPVNANLLYLPEKIKGFEGGVKALLPSRLRVNVAAYRYNYSNLQVNTSDSSGLIPVIRVTNAAQARIQGVEGDFNWRPPLEGLEIRGSANYNDAHFTNYTAPCWLGQTIADGCNLSPSVTGVFQAQSQTGRHLPNAPLWTGSIGFDYSAEAFGGLRWTLTGDENYKSEYNPQVDLHPGLVQKAAWMANASIRLSTADDRWEAAVIGRNLTNVYRVIETSNIPLTGISARTGTNLTGGQNDILGGVTRGREIIFQVTARR